MKHTKDIMECRDDRSCDVKNAGFDSEREGAQLTKYYSDLLTC